MMKSNYFNADEFACKCGCGFNKVSDTLIEKLDKARKEADTPFVITSGCRCATHNKAVKGTPDSAHLTGKAVDIAVAPGVKIHKVLKSVCNNFDRVGINFDKNFIHVDVDTTKPSPTVFKY